MSQQVLSKTASFNFDEYKTPREEHFYRRVGLELGFWQSPLRQFPCHFDVRNGTAYYAGFSHEKAFGRVNELSLFVLRFKVDRKQGLVHVTCLPEEVGPLEDDCPLELIQKADAPTNEKAAAWRQRCLKNDVLYQQVLAGGTFDLTGKPQRLNAELVWTHSVRVSNRGASIVAVGTNKGIGVGEPAETLLHPRDFDKDALYRMLKEGEVVHVPA